MTAKRIVHFLLTFIVVVVLLMAFRWFFISLNKIEVVTIDIPESQSASPLDELLRQEVLTLQSQPQVAEFFARPTSLTNLDSLWINQCEVSQQQFGKFRQWNATREQQINIAHPNQPKNWNYQSKTSGHKLLGRLKMPVSGVSFYDAYAYCQASGGRLPTDEEFEAISNSKKYQLYPWGNTLNKTIAQQAWPYRDPALNVQQCGSAKAASSSLNIHDLGSNLSEWSIDKNNNQAFVMGGNAYNRPIKLHSLNLIKRKVPYDYRSQYVGFRCVYEKPEKLKNSELSLPWGSIDNLISIDSGVYPIGVPPNSKIARMIVLLEPKQYKQLNQLPIDQQPLKLTISKTEITVKQYQIFLDDPLVKLNFFSHKKQPKNHQYTPENWQQQIKQQQKPVTNITWWDAWAFAKWAGGRLPTEREWKRIAGVKETLYPWGNEYAIARSIDRHHPGNKNTPRNVQLSDDATPNGVLGFSGNVVEWTSSVINYGNSYQLIIRGGSYELPYQGSQVSQIASASPHYKNNDLGFRVVFD